MSNRPRRDSPVWIRSDDEQSRATSSTGDEDDDVVDVEDLNVVDAGLNCSVDDCLVTSLRAEVSQHHHQRPRRRHVIVAG